MKSILLRATALLALSLAGCVTAPAAKPDDSASAATPAAPRPPRKFDPIAWVAYQQLAGDCELSAVELKRSSAADAWAALHACVEHGKYLRGTKFVQLGQVIAHWPDELNNYPDAPLLIARIIANRGGDVEGDISKLQAARVPIFSLNAALAQPAIYKGRLLILHAKVQDMNAVDDGAATVVLSETSFRNVSNFRDHQMSSNAWANNRGDSGTYSYRVTDIDNRNNVTYPTGRIALGKLPKVDPFLETDKDFIILGKFEGTKPTDDGRKMGVLTVLSYQAPNAFMLDQ